MSGSSRLAVLALGVVTSWGLMAPSPGHATGPAPRGGGHAAGAGIATPGEPPRGRTLVWERARPGGPVEVTGTRAGGWLARAQREVGDIASRLDALRTARVHVAWTRVAWLGGRVEVTALADSALYANVALLTVRDLYPKRPSAGSGVQQISGLGPTARFRWRVRVLLGRPGGGRVIHIPAGALAAPPTSDNGPASRARGGGCPARPRPGALAPPGTPQGVSRVPSPGAGGGR